VTTASAAIAARIDALRRTTAFCGVYRISRQRRALLL